MVNRYGSNYLGKDVALSIKIENIGKSFGGKKIIENLSLEIPYDKTTVIMGASGKGKTTFLHILIGLVPLDEGKITGCKGKISVVFQEDRLCMNLSPIKNIEMTNKNLTQSEIEENMKKIGLDNCFHQPVREFSGGMKRRIAILRALLCDYEILIMDEPFQGLDEETKSTVISYIKERTGNKTVIIVTHDKEDAKQLDAEVVYLQ